MTFYNIFSKKEKNQKEKPKEKIKIIIDNREKQSLVPSQLSNLGFEIEFQQLHIGDYLVNNTIIERKSINDLKSSIINKRIITQLLELKSYPSSLLIVEGLNEETKKGIIHENALRGLILSIALEFKVPIIFTQDEKDTSSYLSVLAKKKEKSQLSLRPSIKFKSKEERLQFILEGFPNIGPVKSKALIDKFKSLKAIINADEQALKPILGSRTKEFMDLLK
jgi:Fanconi anemia group M protein